MKRIIIICEGPTEQEFVWTVIQPHFKSDKFIIECPLIKKSGGGIVKWEVLKSQIRSHLLEGDAIVTTLIDYYGIPDNYNYPKWEEAKNIVDRIERMDFLEQSMLEEIDDKLRYRFIPYYQLHEFEGLLFNNVNSFDQTFTPGEILNRKALVDIINNHDNPELINNGSTTAPSKRLEQLIFGYSKIVYGCILAENIGLQRIREKAIRFDSWITKLEGL